jgi:methylthioribose-1-phosphate isomerase
MYLAALAAPDSDVEAFQKFVHAAGVFLRRTRPTAVNLEFAVTRQLDAMEALPTGFPVSFTIIF